MKVPHFLEKKKNREPISMVTAYDFQSACLAAKSDVDVLLVGDSVAMVCHGYPSTVHATIDMMKTHTAAVARGKGDKFLVSDLPFGSYRKTISDTVEASTQLIQAGAEAVKLEGAKGNIDTVKHLVESGIPVMGHVGLTPQFVNSFGGHRVQGREKLQAEQILKDAKELEDAGCFSIVIECVPNDLAAEITLELSIPTIGIGAGPSCDGQVLVFYDLLGFQSDFRPKFVRRFMNAEESIVGALNQYHNEVKVGHFPSQGEWY